MELTHTRKTEISNGYLHVKEAISRAQKNSPLHQEVQLVAASKTRSAQEINYLHSLGVRTIGENRVQELCEKYDLLAPDLEIHFIGSLQKNKVKYIIDKVSLIHSVDRLDLAIEIDRQAKKHGKVMDILCEVNLGEAQKSGINAAELPDLLKDLEKLPNLRVRGLMAVPPISHDYAEQFEISQKFVKIFVDNRPQNIDNSSMNIISLGMSGDFPAAIAAGANMIRVGSAIFGARDYAKSH